MDNYVLNSNHEKAIFTLFCKLSALIRWDKIVENYKIPEKTFSFFGDIFWEQLNIYLTYGSIRTPVEPTSEVH